MSAKNSGIALAGLLAIAGGGCSPNDGDDNTVHDGYDYSPDGNTDSTTCTGSGSRCVGTSFQACSGGAWVEVQNCPIACSPSLGCVECNPEATTRICVGDEVHECTSTGDRKSVV